MITMHCAHVWNFPRTNQLIQNLQKIAKDCQREKNALLFIKDFFIQ